MRLATGADLKDLVTFEAQLFAEDAGVHDTHVDPTWSEREGRADFVRLLDEPSALVLVATSDGTAIGHLVAYTAASSPTRYPLTYAILRSMYVTSDRRHQGVGQLLVDRFVSWARSEDCVEAHVSSYVANEPAQNFYQRLGFEPRSLSRCLEL